MLEHFLLKCLLYNDLRGSLCDNLQVGLDELDLVSVLTPNNQANGKHASNFISQCLEMRNQNH